MIAIVNYGSGNVQALATIFGKLGVPCRLASTPADLRECDRALLPGVGSFDRVAAALASSGMHDALQHMVREQGKPILGICVGMQLLARRSEEGALPGLGWIAADVCKFTTPAAEKPLRLPHMGWNDVRPTRTHALFTGVELELGFYFLHSFHLICDNSADVLAEAEYGAPFAAAVASGNVLGVQFHPEKSHAAGVRLLKNFSELQ